MSAEPLARGAAPVPRSRSERTADSRLLILDAAVACLVEEGYAGASTLAVQARAGVSRGRLLHHFPSRAELLVAAAEHVATTQLDAVRLRAAIAAVADGIWGAEIAGSPLYTDLTELLFTSMRGVALVYAFEDRPASTDPHLAVWKRLAARMLALDSHG